MNEYYTYSQTAITNASTTATENINLDRSTSLNGNVSPDLKDTLRTKFLISKSFTEPVSYLSILYLKNRRNQTKKDYTPSCEI